MEEPKALNKKLRLQLFDPNFNQINDRLVGQDIEFSKGPKEPHKGPMKIEVCLFEQEDVDALIAYLGRMRGALPLETKTKKLKANTAINQDDAGWREALLEDLKINGSQEALIQDLRGRGFVFLTWDSLPQKPKPIEAVAEEELAEYQWMLLRVKEAKNPINDKYDPTLMLGFKLLGKKVKKYLVMQYLETVVELALPWEDKHDNLFKKTEMAKFPNYMTLEEREKFRIELYKYRKAPEGFEFSKFFKRWATDVDFREKEDIKEQGLI